MKKIYKKLCAVAFALMGATSLSAQTSWAVPTNGSSYYLYNVDAGRFMNRGNDWGSQGSALGTGEIIKMEVVSEGVYRLRTNNGGQGAFWEADNVWMDGGGTTSDKRIYEWILTRLSDGFYTLTPQGKTEALGMWADTPDNTRLNTRFSVTRNDDAPVRWAFITADQYNAAQATVNAAINARAELRPYIICARAMGFTSDEVNAFYDITSTAATLQAALNTLPSKLLAYALENGTEENPMDLSFLIKNRYCAGTTSWNASGASWATNNWNFKATDNACVWGVYLERWVGSANALSDTELSQNLSGLPVGGYILQVDAVAARQNGSGATITGTQVFAEAYESTSTDISTPDELPLTWKTTFVTIDGNAKVGFKQASTNANWVAFDNFKLYFVGVTLDVLKISLNEALTKANAIDKSTLNTGLKTKLEEAITTGNTALNSENKNDVQEATNNLNSIITLATEWPAAIADANAEIEKNEEIYNNSTAIDKTTYNEAINSAKSSIENASSAVELNSALTALETARQTYVTEAFPTEGYSFDMTFKIINPSFETGNLTGWTVANPSDDTGVRENSNATYTTTGTDGNYLFNTYWKGVPIKQTLTNVPSGTYTMTVAVASDGSTVYLTADSEHSVGITTSDKTSFVDTSIEFICSDGEVTIGAVGGADGDASAHKDFVEEGYWWYKADNFRLTRTFDATSMQTSLTALKTTAASLLEQAMEPSKKTALQSAYGNANATSENPFDLSAWAAELETTIAAAQSSANDYSKIQEYINKTKVFVDESEVATYQNKYDNREYTSEDVEPVRRELNVMRFNAASEVFTQKIEVTGWTGTMGDKNTSSQHWDGTSETKYYDNNSWNGKSHSTSTSIELPAGTYMLKAALRSNASTTMTLTVLDQVVNVEGKGDQGYGIDTSGAANFSDEGTYANEDKGRGWEWEFVKFELAETTTVTLSVECNYNGVYGWASFSDITLWMDDDTYLSVNGGAIDAPLAQAKALNTLPMGDSEMSALISAIALGEAEITTADQLNEALAALETAVANANTWRTAYNEAKAPLITEMELFESDYNDNSVEWSNKCAKGPLCTTIWQAYITAIQEAAVAKDVVTDGYDFDTHTTALENARAAVDASIAVYANLQTEIGYANAYTLVVGSNQTDYTAAINTAQAVWNGGTKEDPSAEILAMQNFKVLDYNYVTETYEGVATLNDWGGNSGSTNKGEHWDGTAESSYYDYSRWSGDAGNFEVTQEYNLPAGTYVLMAAGRCANVDGTDAYIKVKEEKVYFDKKGGSGFGISTDGKASFNPTGTYANTTGRGWEYRFIEFTLNSEETVTIGLGYTVANSYNPLSWAGVCAPQLRAKKLAMTDKADFENETEEGYYVSYDREFAAGTYTTVMVPFDYDLPEGVVAEELNLIAFNGVDNNWISFKEVTTMTANTPYILKNNSATAALFADLGIKTVCSTASTHSVEVEGATMKGTYKEITAAELVEQEDGDIIFINADGKGKYIDDEAPANITFPAGRAYIVVNKNTFSTSTGVAPKFTIFHGDDDLNSIEETVNVEVKDDVIYDLAGRRIVKPTKAGIYIVNGKKMIIK